jgi:hypothetical protein
MKLTPTQRLTQSLGAIKNLNMRLLLSVLTVIILFTYLSCKKSSNENSIKCDFTTKLSRWGVNPPENTICCYRDTIIYYKGNLTYKSGNVVKIDYCPVLDSYPPYGFIAEGIIYPIIDSIGNLTFPDYLSTWGYYFTGGSIKENGDIQIEMGANLWDRGFHESISGHKSN